MLDRERIGRNTPRPLRSWIAKASRRPRRGSLSGFDTGKKVKGCKHNALVDIDGRALVLQVGSVAVQNREGAVPLLVQSSNRFPFIKRIFADSACAGH
jgi:putative transposase